MWLSHTHMFTTLLFGHSNLQVGNVDTSIDRAYPQTQLQNDITQSVCSGSRNTDVQPLGC